jgi:hypothetical protein
VPRGTPCLCLIGIDPYVRYRPIRLQRKCVVSFKISKSQTRAFTCREDADGVAVLVRELLGGLDRHPLGPSVHNYLQKVRGCRSHQMKTRTSFSWEWGHLYRKRHPSCSSRCLPHICIVRKLVLLNLDSNKRCCTCFSLISTAL